MSPLEKTQLTQGRTQDFLQGVSTGSRSKMWGSGAQPPDADKLFIFVMSPCSVFQLNMGKS